MRLTLLTLGISLLVACSTTEAIKQDPVTTPTPTDPSGQAAGSGSTSGSRLKAKMLAAEDGSKTPWGWVDTQRGEDCSFEQIGGRYRCLPASASIRDDFFADASCKKPLVFATKGCATPSVAIQRGAYCASQGYASVRLWNAGAPFTGANIYTKTANTSCTPTPAAPYAAGSDLYGVAEEISLDDFVAADAKAE